MIVIIYHVFSSGVYVFPFKTSALWCKGIELLHLCIYLDNALIVSWLYIDICFHLYIWLMPYSLGTWIPAALLRDGSYCAQLCLNFSVMELQAKCVYYYYYYYYYSKYLYIYMGMVAEQIGFLTTLIKHQFHRFAGSWWVAFMCIPAYACGTWLTLQRYGYPEQ